MKSSKASRAPAPSIKRGEPAAHSKGKKTKPLHPMLARLEGMTMRQWLHDPQLFGPIFEPASWFNWRTILIASRGEPLLPDEATAYQEIVGRPYVPGTPLFELWCAIGRRGGKDSSISSAALFHADIQHRPFFGAEIDPSVISRCSVMLPFRDNTVMT